MGVDCSHGAYSGGYVSFNQMRKIVAAAVGGSFPPHHDRRRFPEAAQWYYDETFSSTEWPGLHAFLEHDDREGEISPDVCREVAKDLRALAPMIDWALAKWECWYGFAVADPERWRSLIARFADGCQRAYEAGEPLVFG